MRRLAAALLLSTLAPVAWADTDCKVTKAQYTALKTGDSYAEAVKVLGCEGEELSSNEIGGYKNVMYMWSGNGFGANMNAMFQNDGLVSKAQFGLK